MVSNPFPTPEPAVVVRPLVIVLDTNSVHRDPYLRSQQLIERLLTSEHISVSVPEIVVWEFAFQAVEARGRYRKFLDLHGGDFTRFAIEPQLPDVTGDGMSIEEMAASLRQRYSEIGVDTLRAPLDELSLLRANRYGRKPFTPKEQIPADEIGRRNRRKVFTHGLADALIWQVVLHELEQHDVIFVSNNAQDFGGTTAQIWEPSPDLMPPDCRHTLICVDTVPRIRDALTDIRPGVLARIERPEQLPAAEPVPEMDVGNRLDVWDVTASRDFDDEALRCLVEQMHTFDWSAIALNEWPKVESLELAGDVSITNVELDGTISVKDLWSRHEGTIWVEAHVPVQVDAWGGGVDLQCRLLRRSG